MTLAVAGFGEDEITVEVKENVLTVVGKVAKESGAKESYLHRGIAIRALERRFNLADHIQVTGAALDKGLLHIGLVRELPEALKPRKITIQGGGQDQIASKSDADRRGNVLILLDAGGSKADA